MHRLTSGWTTLKFLRVVLGGLILYSSINTGHIPGMVIGGLFTLFSLFTNGVCCATGSCYTPRKETKQEFYEQIDYEEVGRK